jgi:predicted sugar kinase
LAAIEEAVAITREACIAFECNKHLEQAGFNLSKPRTTIEQGEDHNHPLGEEDAPRQSVHVHALLLALPVNPSIPEQVLHPITPHRALWFDDQLQLTPARSVTHANNRPLDIRHIAPMLIEDIVYDSILQMV